MKLQDLLESTSLISPEREKAIRDGYMSYYDDEKGEWEADSYLGMVHELHTKGGVLHRCVFLDKISDLRTEDLGTHWTGESQDEGAIAELMAGHGYDDGEEVFFIRAEIGPGQITVEGVDVEGNPEEFEVGIKNQSALRNVTLHKASMWGGKGDKVADIDIVNNKIKPVQSDDKTDS